MLLGFYTYFLHAISREYQQIGTTLPRGLQIRREKAEKGIEIEVGELKSRGERKKLWQPNTSTTVLFRLY